MTTDTDTDTEGELHASPTFEMLRHAYGLIGDFNQLRLSCETMDAELAKQPLDVEELPELMDVIGELESLKKRIGGVVDLLQSVALDSLNAEGGAWMSPDGCVYETKPRKPKLRFDHEDIARQVTARLQRVPDYATGEIVDLDRRSVAAGFEAALALYVSPSTPAKIGALKKTGVNPSDVITEEPNGHEVVLAKPSE